MRNIVALGLVAMLAGCGSVGTREIDFQRPIHPINAVIMPDGGKVYTAGGLVSGQEEWVRREIVAAIQKRCTSPVEVTHWKAWDRSTPIKDWTEFEINAKCKGA